MAKIKASKIIKKAVRQIGKKESPAGSNKVKYTEWAIGKGKVVSSYKPYNWCAIFLDWCFVKSGYDFFKSCPNPWSCGAIMKWAKEKKIWKATGIAGDLAIFDFDGNGVQEHIGLVEKVLSGGYYQTIEGNTGTTSDSNGGEVMRRKRHKKYILGFVRPSYSPEANKAVDKKDAKNPKKTKMRVTAKVGLNIRTGPGKKYGRAGAKKYKAIVYVTKTKKGTDGLSWACINDAGTRWVAKKYLKKA